MSKISSRKMGPEIKDDKREVPSSSSERITRKKRSIDGNYHSEKTQAVDKVRMDKNAKGVQSSGFMDGMSSWDQDSGRTGTDVISFTFSAPMTGSGPGLGRSTEARENCKIFSGGSQSGKRSLLSTDGTSASKFSFLGHNGKGSDALSTLLEQKLKEIACKVEFSEQKSVTVLHDTVPVLKATTNSTLQEWNKRQYGTHMDNQEMQEETSVSDSNVSHPRKLLDCWLPSPVSVLEHSTFADSWNSSDTADSNTMDGSKNCSLIEAREVLDTYSFKTFCQNEGCPELSDSASSTSARTLAKRQECMTRTWELEYVKEILSNIEPMFKDYALGRAHEIINPHLFDQLESRKVYLNRDGGIPRISKRVLFDCVSECVNLRCRQYVSGGCKLWAKGLLTVRRKDRFAEEVYKEISGWSAAGDSMIDELVDKDMSSQHGRWLDYDIEAFELGLQIESRVLNSLIDEVVADMLVL
ncbi:hypothetical protein CDL12_22103 [Handroanthus impetiginosus]|uniref:DUF4378 domain-containing protein n=1 Tax=Handroanthus impetiginosus TaxID=429701 RepID=A0A2G9GJ92_9LAMI|nr:hypothetical protein CDL12_22103 [Handroanthus impetiginosus]